MAKRGGFFDFNCDGKESIFEKALAYKMFEECMKEDEPEEDDDWRDECDDAFEYDLDPYDFDTLEEYEEAKEEIDTALYLGIDDDDDLDDYDEFDDDLDFF